MDVLILAGAYSPEEDPAVFARLVGEEVEKEGHRTETVLVGACPPKHCTGCGKCHGNGVCILDDSANEWKAKLEKADAFVITGAIRNSGLCSMTGALLERLSEMGKASPDFLAGKFGGFGVTGGRDGGMKAIFDVVSFFQHTHATLLWPCYWPFTWNNGDGRPFAECDQEGVALAKDLGNQLNWALAR